MPRKVEALSHFQTFPISLLSSEMTKRHCREWDARNVMACPTHTNLNIDCRRPFVGGMGTDFSLLVRVQFHHRHACFVAPGEV